MSKSVGLEYTLAAEEGKRHWAPSLGLSQGTQMIESLAVATMSTTVITLGIDMLMKLHPSRPLGTSRGSVSGTHHHHRDGITSKKLGLTGSVASHLLLHNLDATKKSVYVTLRLSQYAAHPILRPPHQRPSVHHSLFTAMSRVPKSLNLPTP
jgi:hypothetical protein